LLYDNTCDEVQFHTNRAEHIHLKKARGLSIEQKQIVNRLYTSGVKTPSAILQKLFLKKKKIFLI
jgi:hypothetical protein